MSINTQRPFDIIHKDLLDSIESYHKNPCPTFSHALVDQLCALAYNTWQTNNDLRIELSEERLKASELKKALKDFIK